LPFGLDEQESLVADALGGTRSAGDVEVARLIEFDVGERLPTYTARVAGEKCEKAPGFRQQNIFTGPTISSNS